MQQWESQIVQMVPLPVGCIIQWTVAIFHHFITSMIKDRTWSQRYWPNFHLPYCPCPCVVCPVYWCLYAGGIPLVINFVNPPLNRDPEYIIKQCHLCPYMLKSQYVTVLEYPVSEFFEFQTLSLKTCASILRIPTLDSLKDICSGSFVCLVEQKTNLPGRPNELLKELLLKLQNNFPVPPLFSIFPKNFKSLNSRLFGWGMSHRNVTNILLLCFLHLKCVLGWGYFTSMIIKIHNILGLLISPPGNFTFSLHSVSYYIRSKARILLDPLNKSFTKVLKLDHWYRSHLRWIIIKLRYLLQYLGYKMYVADPELPSRSFSVN